MLYCATFLHELRRFPRVQISLLFRPQPILRSGQEDQSNSTPGCHPRSHHAVDGIARTDGVTSREECGPTLNRWACAPQGLVFLHFHTRLNGLLNTETGLSGEIAGTQWPCSVSITVACQEINTLFNQSNDNISHSSTEQSTGLPQGEAKVKP